MDTECGTIPGGPIRVAIPAIPAAIPGHPKISWRKSDAFI